MDFKEFLEPSLGKIIILIILVYPLTLSLTYQESIPWMFVDCSYEAQQKNPDCGGLKFLTIGFGLGISEAFVASIIISYLLSCLLVTIARWPNSPKPSGSRPRKRSGR